MPSCRKKFLFLIILSLSLLVGSWILPQTRAFWDQLDIQTYHFFHHNFLSTPLQQRFWAIMNSRLADNCCHLLFIFVLLRFSFSARFSPLIKKRLLLIITLLAAVVLSVVLTKTAEHYINYKRQSPSLTLGYEVRLSQVLPNLKNVKDASVQSFPGDHAMTLFLLTFLIYRYTTLPYKILATFLIIPFIMPRLISGGHWLTDLLIGSLPIALLWWIFWTTLFDSLSTSLTFLKKHESEPISS